MKLEFVSKCSCGTGLGGTKRTLEAGELAAIVALLSVVGTQSESLVALAVGVLHVDIVDARLGGVVSQRRWVFISDCILSSGLVSVCSYRSHHHC